MFYYSSCSNNSSENSWQENQENKNPEIVQQDTTTPPKITILENLADSSKPKCFLLGNTPKPQTITIPEIEGTSYILQTKSGPKKIELSPPKHAPLSVLKNNKGEVIKDNNGSPFILGEAGGYSNFTNYTTDNGLALDAIACGLRDKTGNLWFGTDGGGVSRYDGKSFTNFTTAQGLANNGVLSITEDKTGNLWFGTQGGVSRYDGKSFTNFTTAQGLANNTVFSITEDGHQLGTDGARMNGGGNLWFGTNGGGVSRYDGSRANHPCNKNT